DCAAAVAAARARNAINMQGRIAIFDLLPIRSIGSVAGARCQACLPPWSYATGSFTGFVHGACSRGLFTLMSPWDGRSVFVARHSAASRQATKTDGLPHV